VYIRQFAVLPTQLYRLAYRLATIAARHTNEARPVRRQSDLFRCREGPYLLLLVKISGVDADTLSYLFWHFHLMLVFTKLFCSVVD